MLRSCDTNTYHCMYRVNRVRFMRTLKSEFLNNLEQELLELCSLPGQEYLTTSRRLCHRAFTFYASVAKRQLDNKNKTNTNPKRGCPPEALLSVRT